MARQRTARYVLVRLAAALWLLALGSVLALAPGASADKPTEIVVEDTAGILDSGTLMPALRDIEFHEPTKVVVFTERGSAGDNFNERVLGFARAEHPEWISEDGQKWADGLYIVAIDPDGRHVGTYMGEDRKVSLDQREDIQESMFDLLRDAQWTGAAIVGVEEGAAVINRPWYRSPLLYVGGSAAVLIGGGTAVAGAYVRGSRRKNCAAAIETGDRSYSNVTLDLEVTDLNASTIPEDSAYGGKILERHRGFATDYAAVHAMREELHATTARERSRKATLEKAVAYRDRAVRLDALDDVIADSNDFLNKSSNWERAWDRQTEDFRADLDAIDGTLDGPDGHPESATAAALRAFRGTAAGRLEAWGAGLADGSTTPDAALDSLAEARDELSQLLENHTETVIAGFAKSDSERATMREKMAEARNTAGQPRRSGAGILDIAFPSRGYFSVPSFAAGYSAAQGSVEAERTAASSGSSTGYGSSGGSFSGSGSSSRF
jgi:uncharacterized membrane protein YgcG